MSFPPEVREIIYECLLIERNPLTISQRRTKLDSSFLHLSPLSKNLNQEINAFFFRKNTFHIGDHTQSYISPSARGLKSFLRRVPKQSLACIKKLHLTITFSELHWDEKVSDHIWTIDKRSRFNWMERMFTRLHTDFTSLRYLELRDRIIDPGPLFVHHPRHGITSDFDIIRIPPPFLSQESSMKGLVKVLEKGITVLKSRRGFQMRCVPTKYWYDTVIYEISQLRKAWGSLPWWEEKLVREEDWLAWRNEDGRILLHSGDVQ